MTSFFVLVFMVAFNVVAVRFTNREIPPFWGAATRFAVAGFLFGLIVFLRRIPLPRGQALARTLLYGCLQFGAAFALVYWALQEVPAGLASVILASAPIFTILFAVLAGQETLRLRSMLGALIAIGGIAVILGVRQEQQVPIVYLLVTIIATACFSLSPVIVKSVPQVHPAAMNTLGMFTGLIILLSLSLALGENWTMPTMPATWLAQLYLMVPGSVGLFALFLFLLGRWPASRVSYQAVLTPIVTVLLSAWLLDEPLTGGLFLGGILVLAGVYIGAFSSGRRRVVPPSA